MLLESKHLTPSDISVMHELAMEDENVVLLVLVCLIADPMEAVSCSG